MCVHAHTHTTKINSAPTHFLFSTHQFPEAEVLKNWTWRRTDTPLPLGIKFRLKIVFCLVYNALFLTETLFNM